MKRFVLQSTIDHRLEEGQIFTEAPDSLGVDQVVNFGNGISNLILQTEDKTEVLKFIGSHHTLNTMFKEVKELDSDQYVLRETLNSVLQKGNVLYVSSEEPDVEIRVGAGIHKLVLESLDGTVYLFSGNKKRIDDMFRYIPVEQEEVYNDDYVVESIPGPQGQQGEQGPVGPMGPAGPKGSPGMPGQDGERGPKGEKGDPGEQGIPGPAGEKGDAGEQGIPGPAGEKGDRGSIGPKGDRGEKGEKGDVGPKGEIGPEGKQGNRGPRGSKGEKGDKGDVGSAGPRGLKGEKGNVGPKGPKGDKGDPGEKGEKGDKGDRGEKGNPGESGILNAKYPLVYDAKGKEIRFETKKLEELLQRFSNLGPGQNGPDYAAITDWLAAAGGAVAVRNGNSGDKMIIKSLNDLILQGPGVTLAQEGKNVRVTISGSGEGSAGIGSVGIDGGETFGNTEELLFKSLTPGLTLTASQDGTSTLITLDAYDIAARIGTDIDDEYVYESGSIFTIGPVTSPGELKHFTIPNELHIHKAGIGASDYRYTLSAVVQDINTNGQSEIRVVFGDSPDRVFLVSNGAYDGTKYTFDIDNSPSTTNSGKRVTLYGYVRPSVAENFSATRFFRFPDGTTAESIVTSFNGQTGDVTFNEYVSSWNGQTGDVQGVSSWNGQTGDVTFNDYVSSWNGQTGDVTFNDYVESFNGQTGAIEGVFSVNGETGDVTVSGGGGVTYSVAFFLDGDSAPISLGHKVDALRQIPVDSTLTYAEIYSQDGAVLGSGNFTVNLAWVDDLEQALSGVTGSATVINLSGVSNNLSLTPPKTGTNYYHSGVPTTPPSVTGGNWVYPIVTANTSQTKIQLFMSFVPS